MVEYEAAIISTGLVSLEARRANLSAMFFSKAKETPPIRDVIPLVTQVSHGYTLRSGSASDVKVNARTERFRSFITMRYVYMYVMYIILLFDPYCNSASSARVR